MMVQTFQESGHPKSPYEYEEANSRQSKVYFLTMSISISVITSIKFHRQSDSEASTTARACFEIAGLFISPMNVLTAPYTCRFSETVVDIRSRCLAQEREIATIDANRIIAPECGKSNLYTVEA